MSDGVDRPEGADKHMAERLPPLLDELGYPKGTSCVLIIHSPAGVEIAAFGPPALTRLLVATAALRVMGEQPAAIGIDVNGGTVWTDTSGKPS